MLLTATNIGGERETGGEREERIGVLGVKQHSVAGIAYKDSLMRVFDLVHQELSLVARLARRDPSQRETDRQR